MTKKRLDELLAKYEPRLAARFRSLMQRVRGRRSAAELEVMIERGATSEAIGTIMDDVDAAAQAMASEVAALDMVIGRAVSAWIGEEVGKLISYDGANARAVQRLASSRDWLRRWWGADQQQAIDAVLEEVGAGLVEGINPRQMAIAIRDSIGLTPDRARAVANYRKALEANSRRTLGYELRDHRSDRAVARAIKDGKPLSQAQIDKLVNRYHERQIAHRAEAIARTESARALHEADDESFAQAVEAGHLEEDRIQCEWHAGTAPRTRDSHVKMRGQLRRLRHPFTTGKGYSLRYPCDPEAPSSEVVNCRCRVSRKILPAGRVAVDAARASEPASA